MPLGMDPVTAAAGRADWPSVVSFMCTCDDFPQKEPESCRSPGSCRKEPGLGVCGTGGVARGRQGSHGDRGTVIGLKFYQR